ncbi:MAG: hypothetical protein HYV63_17465 [Candidatus Schekmanbacteria bacterium]|nr:hypothetical protein [Candidatus Schekmanbacteria bacterium]
MTRISTPCAWVLAVVIVAAAPHARAQLSSGELAAPHAELEGSDRCFSCHNAAEGVSPDACLSCHKVLAARVAAGKGLHAREEYRACARCHVDHHGRSFPLVWWGDAGKSGFAHGTADFALVGKHRSIACETCHSSRNVADAAASRAAGVDPNRTFLGLSGTCSTCHRDPHQANLELIPARAATTRRHGLRRARSATIVTHAGRCAVLIATSLARAATRRSSASATAPWAAPPSTAPSHMKRARAVTRTRMAAGSGPIVTSATAKRRGARSLPPPSIIR